jgi:hypothetical protein
MKAPISRNASCALLTILFFVVASRPASSSTLDVSGGDLLWNTDNTSPTMTFTISNQGTSDQLYGWQLGLVIVPDGATGELQFDSASLPATDYLLEGRSDGLFPAFAGPDDTISLIGDTDSDFSGIDVLAAWTPLLQVDFIASPDAVGRFNVALIPGEFNGAWYSSDFSARPYGNASFTGGDQVIGSVTLVPEPRALMLLVIAGATLLLVNTRYRAQLCET